MVLRRGADGATETADTVGAARTRSEQEVGHQGPRSEFARKDVLVRDTFSIADKFLSGLKVI